MAYHGGNLKCTSINGVKMYTVSGNQRSLATWLNPKKQRALRKDNNYMTRVELIQDLRFETATTKIKATPDGEFLIASGIYPPQVKVYELRELALKFERHLVSEIIDFQVLGDDYSKIAFLCADRSIQLHAKYGNHYQLRIPRVGRDMAYDSWSCDLLCAASSPDLYRINLDQGRFLSSLSTQSPALNVVSRSNFHGLVACGGEDGAVECFDMRTRSAVGRIDAVAPAGDIDQEVTALSFEDEGGFLMAVGSSTGKVLIYDLRSNHPLQIKDHMYGASILDIKWHKTLNTGRAKLITTDHHIVRVWDPETKEGLTSIEPSGGRINDACIFSESGLMLLALDCSQIPSYFIPALGPAPKWCSYLENYTEELEEDPEPAIYDDYKFLSREDLEKFNLTSYIGTDLLRAYMHGYFVDYRLYKKVKAMMDPVAHDSYIEQRKKEKQEAERASRISTITKLPKVNRKLVSEILHNEAETEKDADGGDAKKKSKKKKGLSSEIFKDDRFGSMFNNKDFQIDEKSREYTALHPVAPTKQPSLLNEHYDEVLDVGDENLTDSDAPDSAQSLVDDDHSGSRSKRVRIYEMKDERHADAFSIGKSLRKEDSLSIGERVASLQDKQQASHSQDNVKFGIGGSREISFVSRSSAKYIEDDDDEDEPREKKRGVQSLRLQPDRSGFRGRGRGGSRGRGGGRGRGGARGGGGGRGRGRSRGRGF